ncbi:hypothetical protein QCE88_41555 [Caballeronia sp. LZ035]|nr:hypothetical protein [Caballeronia sp. LZ035]MDR5763460.1 hypothetical protein [Caballeronia sp. LZ035]
MARSTSQNSNTMGTRGYAEHALTLPLAALGARMLRRLVRLITQRRPATNAVYTAGTFALASVMVMALAVVAAARCFRLRRSGARAFDNARSSAAPAAKTLAGEKLSAYTAASATPRCESQSCGSLANPKFPALLVWPQTA